jgi:hypothetical protein
MGKTKQVQKKMTADKAAQRAEKLARTQANKARNIAKTEMGRIRNSETITTPDGRVIPAHVHLHEKKKRERAMRRMRERKGPQPL